jgi:16S rRNA G966 N2-methylase RsmD
MAVFPVQPQCLSVFLSASVRVYEILRRYIEDESADLVHLDPPFVWRKKYPMPLLTQNTLFYVEMKGDYK